MDNVFSAFLCFFVFDFVILFRCMKNVVQSRKCNVAHTFMRCENVLSTIRRIKHTLWIELIVKGIALSVKIYWAIHGNRRHSVMQVAIRSGQWSRYDWLNNSEQQHDVKPTEILSILVPLFFSFRLISPMRFSVFFLSFTIFTFN